MSAEVGVDDGAGWRGPGWWPRLPSAGNPAFAAVLVAGFAATVGIGLWGLTRNPYGFMDLDVYRLGVHAWLTGQDMYGTLPPTSHGEQLPFIYPPFGALALSPLAVLPWPAAWVGICLVSLASLAFVLYLVLRRAWPDAGRTGALLVTGALLPLSLFLEPVQETFWYGQVNLLLMALVVADCLVERPRWPRGLLVGVAAAIKLTPAGFLLFFLLRRDFQAAVTAVSCGVLATAIGFAANWSGSLRFWFSATGLSTAARTPFATNQTIMAALERMNLPLALQTTLWLAISAVVLVLAVAGIRRALGSGAPDALPLAMVINAAAILAVSPTAWGHHWVYVVPALVVLLARGVVHRSPGWLVSFCLLAAAFVLEPFYWCPVLTSEVDHRMHWTPAQHVYGNTYVLLTVLLLGGYAGRQVVPDLCRRWAGRARTRAASLSAESSRIG